MKRLVICTTYSQLLLAVQLKLTLFIDDEIDLWLSDTSKGSEEVYKRLKETFLFHQVIYVKCQEFLYNQGTIKNFWDIISYNFASIKKCELYDEVIFYNLTLKIYEIADYYHKLGYKAKWSRFEEGIFSYNTDIAKSNRIAATRMIRKIINRPDVFQLISRFYCIFPSLKDTHKEWEFVAIPDFSVTINLLRKYLNQIFNYCPEKQSRYIYFASSSDIDKTPYGETEFVLKLANYVGKDNLLVKMHPRDTRSVYADYGIKVMENSYIPWEVIQMNLESSDCTFLTVNSGSFISITAMLNKPVCGYFLYNIINCSTEAFISKKNEIHNMLTKLHDLGVCKGIADDIKDLKSL